MLRERVVALQREPAQKVMAAHTLTGFMAGCAASRFASSDARWCDDVETAVEQAKGVIEGIAGHTPPLIGLATDPGFVTSVMRQLNVSGLSALEARIPWYSGLVDSGLQAELDELFAFDIELFEWVLSRSSYG